MRRSLPCRLARPFSSRALAVSRVAMISVFIWTFDFNLVGMSIFSIISNTETTGDESATDHFVGKTTDVTPPQSKRSSYAAVEVIFIDLFLTVYYYSTVIIALYEIKPKR